MRLGLYQATSPSGDIDAGLAVLNDALHQAKAASIDMLVLPELFLPGYQACVHGALGDTVIDKAQAAAADHGVALTIGLPEPRDGATFNSAFSFGSDGALLATYQKIQLFGPDEAGAFKAGSDYVVFDYKGVRFGLMICYDVEFPEHVRALKRLGAQAILVPTANMEPFSNVNQYLVPARAMENAVTVVYANYCGSEGALEYVGRSLIAGPDGHSLAVKGHAPGLAFADLPTGWREHDVPLSTQLQDLKPL